MIRFFSQCVSRNWRRPHWRILYYHAVPSERERAFADQLDWFSAQFTWCTVADGVAAINSGTIDRPLMSLTFDDADQTLRDVVMPILQQRKIRACCYVVPDYVAQGVSYRDDQPRPIMTWKHLEEWIDEGHEVGSHTYTHAPLNRCTASRCEQELVWSQIELEQRLGFAVRHFAYPWGQHNEHTRQMIKASQRYDSVATIQRGPMQVGHDVLSLRRDRGDLGKSPAQMETAMRLADRFYWARKLRVRRIKSYWEQNPAERWEALELPESLLT